MQTLITGRSHKLVSHGETLMNQTVNIPSGIWPVMLAPFDEHDRVDWLAAF